MSRVPKFLTTADAAKILQVTPGAVRLMQQRGELPLTAETEGGIQLYARPDVVVLAKRRMKRAVKAAEMR